VNYRFLLLAVLMCASSQASAADPNRAILGIGGTSSVFINLGFEFQSVVLPLVGFNGLIPDEVTNVDVDLGISLEGRLQYRGAFIEVIDDSFSNITAGFSLHEDSRSSLEIIVTNLFEFIRRNEFEGFETIEDRDGDINLGMRGSYFFGKNLVQLELVGDVSDAHDGVIGAAHFGRQKQLGNWNLHGLLGIRYFSDGVLDHFFGINANEATDLLPEYQAEDGFLPSIQLGAIYPISENWTLDLKTEYSRLPDSVADSPLAQGNDFFQNRIAIRYVFSI